MTTIAEPLVDICLLSSSTTHTLATEFPITTLKRISARFATDFDEAKPDVVKVVNATRLKWTIRDPASFLSVKGFRLVLTWLCAVLPDPRPNGPHTLAVDSTGEQWGFLGVVAVRQACGYLRLRGEVADQFHLSVWLHKFLTARWTFAWDQRVLGWDDVVRGGWDDVVCAWVYSGVFGDREAWRGELLDMAVARVQYWTLERAKVEHRNFVAAVDGYHGRADDLKRWYEELSERPMVTGRLFNVGRTKLRYSLASLNGIPEPPPFSPVEEQQASRVDTQMLDYGDADTGGAPKGKVAELSKTPVRHESNSRTDTSRLSSINASSGSLEKSEVSQGREALVKHSGTAQIDTPMLSADADDAEEGEIEESADMINSQDRKRKRAQMSELYRRKRCERHDIYTP